jgi:hypothetical protein
MAYTGQWNPAAGTNWTYFVVLSAGGFVDCHLPTSPTLELRDAAGTLLAVAEPFPASPSRIVLPPATAAATIVGFADWCSAQPALPLQLNLMIGSTRLPVVTRSEIPVPGCNSAPETPPFFGYGGPLTIPGPPQPEPDLCDVDEPLSVMVSPLPTVHPGETMTYTITLTNRSAHEKPINPAASCPNYTQRLSLPESARPIDRQFALNWTRGMLAAGERATFEMRLQIPADATAGTAGIVWQLGERGPDAKATFQIAP